MRIKEIVVKNFRLLHDVTLCLEDETTVIVGRNNSGKTSLTELFRRLIDKDGAAKFTLEDFCLLAHEQFWDAFVHYDQQYADDEVRAKLPVIEVELTLSYGREEQDLGVLSDFLIDLDVNTTEAKAVIRYQLRDGQMHALFAGCSLNVQDQDPKTSFFKLIRERVQELYSATLFAVDPTDKTNRLALDMTLLKRLLKTSFITAQRGLDDTTHKEKDVLGKILQKLLSNASEETAAENERQIKNELETVVFGIQDKIEKEFNTHVTKLLPTLSRFGYPGLNDPQFQTETTLNVQRLLENHTKIRYEGKNGIGLPESYNGLGSRNLIYILFQLFEFFKSYQAHRTAPGVHLIFIEEPEAHLHPQMQEVFVRQLSNIIEEFEKELNNGEPWPVQFVVSTHSTHMANEAPFESIRYFLSRRNGKQCTEIKDLRTGFEKGVIKKEDKEFLSKYMTLTRCDLFFADKAILIEGPTERLLMPRMIEKVDEESTSVKLSSQYITVMEVGGAYAHLFYRLLDFLELRALVVTDLDTANKKGKKCKVSEGVKTSNASIKSWFGNGNILPTTLLGKTAAEKIIEGRRRIAYQIPESGSNDCGRSFEDAFLLANQEMLGLKETSKKDKETTAWEKAKKLPKTNFALKLAIEQTDWAVPLYLKEGLQWLAELDAAPAPAFDTREDHALKEARHDNPSSV